jgi:predicted dinucleotide-binding enzyme
MPEVVAQLGGALGGRLVMDATNLGFGSPSGPMSAVEALAAAAPGARIYRAFNSVGWENIRAPLYGSVRADMVFCGPAGEGREVAERLIADAGFRPIYVGDLDRVPVVDNLGRLWGALAMGQGMGRRLGFKLLTE